MSALLLVVALAASPATEELARGKTAFTRGEYERAIEVLRPLLHPTSRLETDEEVVSARRMLGVSYLFAKDQISAKRELLELLRLRPTFRFDPLVTSQAVVEFFNAIVKEQEQELGRLEVLRKQAEETEKNRRVERLTIERRYEHHSLVLALIPFGAGQFQNGQRGKGWAFLVSEVVLGTASVAAWIRNEDLARAAGGPGRSETYSRVRLVAGGLFWAVAIFGVVDAVRYHKPVVPLSQAEPTHRGRLAVQPLVGPGGIGIGGTF